MSASKHGATFARQSLLIKVLRLLLDATTGQLAAILRFLGGEPLGNAEGGGRNLPVRNVDCGLRNEGEKDAELRNLERVFRFTGRDWVVVIDGLGPFYLANTLVARYVGYWLHHPNQPIGAFDLEVLIQPEKGKARSRNSIQAGSDAQARSQYRPELERLRARQAEAQAAGAQEEVERLEEEIQMYQALLDERCGAADTGRRAFDNIRQLVRALRAHLRRGGLAERRFEEDLRRNLSLGLECVYNSPDGKVWS